jgi:hypothetical protein
MSPAETTLRDALHDGEGERVQPRRVIARAHTVQLRRRRAVTTAVGVAGAAVVLTGTASAINRLGEHSARSTATARSAAPCPSHPPTVAAGPGTAPLFADQLSALTVCVYAGDDLAAGWVLDAAAARAAARTIDGGSPSAACSPAPGRRPTLVLLPRSTSGPGRPSTARRGPCGYIVTNGQGTRSGTAVDELVQTYLSEGGER